MPNIKSAKKRVKVEARRALRNKILKTQIKTLVKKVNVAAVENSESKQDVLRSAFKKLDQSVEKGVLHKNCAARKKSQLARLCK